MATPTYDLLASTTLTADTTSITMSSISQDYGDLVFVSDYVKTGGNSPVYFILNGDTGRNYDAVFMRGNGSSAASDTQNSFRWQFNEGMGGLGSLLVVNIFDYTATDKHTSALARYNETSTNAGTQAVAARWSNTAAVNSLSFSVAGDDFAAGSTFNLYGVAK